MYLIINTLHFMRTELPVPEQPVFLGTPAEANCYWYPGTKDSHLDDLKGSLEDFQSECYVPANYGCIL